MSGFKCLSEQELSEFVHGRITAERVEQIAEHLEDCDDCQSTVVLLGEKSDTFVEQLRSPAVPDALEAEAACQAAVERLADRAAERRSGPTATPAAMDEIGQLGPYRIDGQLGVGGMGTVFQATHTKLKRTVALKLLPATRWANPSAVARFEREMEVIGQLDHPNIVRASDAGEESGMHYLVMEHVDGLDLSRVVNRVGPLAVADACEIARQAAIGLQYASENHLVHRDIKPSNLMLASQEPRAKRQDHTESNSRHLSLGSRPSVKILDLGLALLSEAHSAHENELTTVGQLMGTLDYMSPEQGMDSHDVDIRADIYSLGATLYKLLTGTAPFAAPQYNTLLKKVTALANKPVTPIKQVRPEIPEDLANVIDRMLSKEPAERFNMPEEVAAALEPFASEADLGSLLHEALQAKEAETNALPPVISTMQTKPTSIVAPKSTERRRGSRRWIVAALLTIFVLLAWGAAIVIRLATDQGEIVVRADESAQLVIRKGGQTVREFEVAKGGSALTVRSGDYEIELKGNSDELMVSRNAVSIMRGGVAIVHVQRRPKAAGSPSEMGAGSMMGSGMMGSMEGGMAGAGGMEAMSPSGMPGGAMGSSMFVGDMSSGGGDVESKPEPEPIYDGRLYSHWLRELKTERKPERLTEAIRALEALTDTDDAERSAKTAAGIMHAMRIYGSNSIDRSLRGQLIQQAHDTVLKLSSDTIVAAIKTELKEGTEQSRSFTVLLLSPHFGRSRASRAPQALADKLAVHQPELTTLLINLPDEDAAWLRVWGLLLVTSLAQEQNTPLAQIDGLLPKMREILRTEQDFQLLSAATNVLVQEEPDNKLLVPSLLRLLSSEDIGFSSEASGNLGKLGSRAAPAIKPLMKIVTTELNRPKEGGDGGGGLGGFGGGGGRIGGGGDTSKTMLVAAINALGRIGPTAKDALPLLRSIKQPSTAGEAAGVVGAGFASHDRSVAKAARIAIARIEGKEPADTSSDDTGAAPGGGGFF